MGGSKGTKETMGIKRKMGGSKRNEKNNGRTKRNERNNGNEKNNGRMTTLIDIRKE